MSTEQYSVQAAIESMQRIHSTQGWRPWRLTIRKCNPGALSNDQTTDVSDISAGFDWEAGQVVITPARPLTELTTEQVAEISKSARGGQSWHAYQAQKKLREQVDSLKTINAELLEALRRAVDALDALTDKVDRTGFAQSDEFANALDEIDLGRAVIAKATREVK